MKQSRVWSIVWMATAMACVSGSAWAQGGQRMPLEKAVQTGEDAKRILSTNRISAAVAQQIGMACVDAARAVNGAVSVFVLSNDGQVAFAYRMDGQDTINTETALLKAETALRRGESTRQSANQFATLDAKLIRVNMGFYLVAGGLPIVVDDVMIGSIGVGGGRGINDEQCAYQALTKVLGPQPPLAPALPPNPLGNAGGGRGAGGGGAGAGAPAGGAPGRGGAQQP
jgi:glc operon protein GlcG